MPLRLWVLEAPAVKALDDPALVRNSREVVYCFAGMREDDETGISLVDDMFLFS